MKEYLSNGGFQHFFEESFGFWKWHYTAGQSLNIVTVSELLHLKKDGFSHEKRFETPNIALNPPLMILISRGLYFCLRKALVHTYYIHHNERNFS